MQIPCFGEPFGDTPPQCSGCRDKCPPVLGSQCWIRPFFSEMPNLALLGDSDVWERGGSSAALDRAALQLHSGAGEPWHCQSPPQGPGTPGAVGSCSPALDAPGPDLAAWFSAGLRTPSNSLHTGAS